MGNTLIDYYAEKLKNTPITKKATDYYERGLLTYKEALQMIIESEEKNHFYYVIQYKGYIEKKYHDYCEILYTWEEAKEELQRLKEAAPDFSWRTRKELK